MNNNRCICCGAIIPEGRQVCYRCSKGKIIGGVLAVAVSLTAIAAPIQTRATGNDNMGTLCMDVDYNGVIDGRDATTVLTEYASTSVGKNATFTDTQRFVADTNLDGIVDARDATDILSTYAYNSTHESPKPIKTVTFTLRKQYAPSYWISLDKDKYFIEDLLHSIRVDSQDKSKSIEYYIDVKILRWENGLGFPDNCFLDIVPADDGFSIVKRK